MERGGHDHVCQQMDLQMSMKIMLNLLFTYLFIYYYIVLFVYPCVKYQKNLDKRCAHQFLSISSIIYYSFLSLSKLPFSSDISTGFLALDVVIICHAQEG